MHILDKVQSIDPTKVLLVSAFIILIIIMSIVSISNVEDKYTIITNLLLVYVTILLAVTTYWLYKISEKAQKNEEENVRKARLFATYFEYNKRFAEILMRVPSKYIEDQKVADNDMDFDKIMRVYFNLCQEEYYLNEAKLLEEAIWKAWMQGMKNYMKKAAFEDAWRRLGDSPSYSNEFRGFMKDKILS